MFPASGARIGVSATTWVGAPGEAGFVILDIEVFSKVERPHMAAVNQPGCQADGLQPRGPLRTARLYSRADDATMLSFSIWARTASATLAVL
jgi:hypothetical protein